MKISYAIPVCNEYKELDRLLNFLLQYKREQDEIVVQCDQGNTTDDVHRVLSNYHTRVRIFEFPLKGNFANFKNNLKNSCLGDWIFQIDADEMLSEWLICNLPQILIDNPEVQLFCIPRINIVDGLTQEHIQKWGWRVNEKGWINFPDVQTRIIQNSSKIQWVGKVHEVITGHTSHAILPIDEEYCIIHNKHIHRQEMQNNYYNTI